MYKTTLAAMKFLTFLAFILSSFTAEGLEKKEIVDSVNTFMRKYDIPGLALVVIDKGTSTFYGFGVADKQSRKLVTENTLFEIGSVTKVFASDCLALEVLNGKMKLDDPAVKYIKELHHGYVGPFRDVTLEELATHTSSLPRMPPHFKGRWKNKEHVLHFLRNWKPSYPIGTHYLYSNLGFGILGWTLADLDNSTFYPFLKEKILTPLNMNETFMRVPSGYHDLYAVGYNNKGRIAPYMNPTPLAAGGALRSSARDMTAFLLCNMGLDGPKELQRAFLWAQIPRFKVSDKLSMALGWQDVHLNGLHLCDKNGGVAGFASYIGFLPEKKSGVVILCNRSKSHVTQLGRNLLQQLGRDRDQSGQR